jgi:macrolide transport system ATP-binding/permease protein
MRRLRSWLSRLADFDRDRRWQDLTEEIRANLEMHIEENMRSGMSRDEARRIALLEFRSVDAVRESVRDQRGLPFIEAVYYAN